MKALQVIQSAYRCTIEEQDDPAVWIAHAMKGAGADLGVLLAGNAVNYAVQGQDCSGLRFGDVPQTQPPRLGHEVESLAEKGVPVYAVAEDAAERGIEPGSLGSGVEMITAAGIPALFARYDQIWNW